MTSHLAALFDFLFLARSPTDILRQRTKDVEVKKYCIHLLEKLGSFKYTRDILQTLDAEARAEVRLQFPCLLKWALLIASCLFVDAGQKSGPKQVYGYPVG